MHRAPTDCLNQLIGYLTHWKAQTTAPLVQRLYNVPTIKKELVQINKFDSWMSQRLVTAANINDIVRDALQVA